jgi:hypothetical protein
MVKGDAFSKRIRHNGIVYHYFKDKLRNENTHIELIPARLNLANIFKKTLSLQKHNFTITALLKLIESMEL